MWVLLPIQVRGTLLQKELFLENVYKKERLEFFFIRA